MTRKTDAEKLADLDAKKKALEAQMSAITARQKEAVRKADTRRKIILGSALLAKAATDEKFAKVLDVLLKGIERDVDKAAFEGWTAPKPTASTGSAAPQTTGQVV